MSRNGNVILFNHGPNPPYLETCLIQIQTHDPNVDIYFIGTDKNGISSGVKFYSLLDLSSETTRRFDLTDFQKTNENPLFRTSMERFFYIKSLIQNLNLTNIFHFDNDVMLYYPFNRVLSNINSSSQVLMTPTNELNLTCGMMYIKNEYSISLITKELLKKIEIGESKLMELYGHRRVIYENRSLDSFHVNEMTLLKIVQEENSFIQVFPTMPHAPEFRQFGICFDPSSWGQNLGGTHQGHPPGYFDLNHFIGRAIQKHRHKVIFENHRPYIVSDNKKYELFNLHIHSKHLKRFI